LANPTKITVDSIVSVATDQVSCELEGEAAILNLASGAYHGLDAVGLAVWNMIAQPIEVAKIVDNMMAQYDVDRARCERDVLELLAKLDTRGLIQISNGAGG
jgi:hypothetical protein